MKQPEAGRSRDVNGIQMHFEELGSGEPLLLLHGFAGSSADWVHVFNLEELGREYRVLAPDLRGHGRTTPVDNLTIRQCALDVLEWLDQLGISRYRAVGLSLGGKTLLHLATLQPDRLEAMVMVSATPYFPPQARALMAHMKEENQSAEEWAVMRARHKHGDGQIRALWRIGHGFKDSYDDMCFTPPQLSRIRARTLIVAGDRDPMYPVELSLEMYRAIPNASLWVVPGGDHGPIFGDQREAFAATARAFLRAGAG
jgi:pimeloyl-ACP methyl ester carboxylesterase